MYTRKEKDVMYEAQTCRSISGLFMPCVGQERRDEDKQTMRMGTSWTSFGEDGAAGYGWGRYTSVQHDTRVQGRGLRGGWVLECEMRKTENEEDE